MASAGSHMKIAHLTTVDMSLRLLLFPQLRAVVEAGGEAVGISAPGPWVPELESAGIRHVALGSSTRGVDWRADLRAMIELWKVLRRERPDVLHTHNPKPGIYGRILGRLAGVPVVVNTVHGYYATPDDPLAKRLIVYVLESIAARFGDVELFQNPEDLALAERLRLVPSGKAHLLGNGVDLQRFRPGDSHAERSDLRSEWGLSEADVVVGVVGRLVEEKGYVELFEAMASLSESAVLVVAGPDDETKPDALPREIIESARDRGVRFLGLRHDVESLYRAFDLFVLPSHREGFPRAAMEAAASGLPIIATDIRGCRQVVDHGETGLLVPVRDAAALAEAIGRLVGDADTRRAMAGRARNKAEREFDEDRVVDIVMREHRRQWERRGRRWPLSPEDSGGVTVRAASRSDLPTVARLHSEGIGGGFLSRLGQGFLEELYAVMVAEPDSIVLVAEDGFGRVVGFIAGTRSTSGLYRAFLLSWHSVRAVSRSWRAMARVSVWREAFETLRYGGDGQAPDGGELLAMAVDESERGRGVGRELGQRLIDGFRANGVVRAIVVVGADNLPAQRLYGSLGFGDPRHFEVHAGRPSVMMTWSE